MATSDQEAEARLLAFYDQKIRETIERLEELERTAAEAPNPIARAAQIARSRIVLDDATRQAARLREARLP